MSSTERRSDLRQALGVSLDRWLASVATKVGVPHLVLADSVGLLVASNAPGPDAERLAAQVCALPEMQSGTPRIDVLRLEGGDEELLLCASGDPDRRREALAMAEPGIRRILMQSRG